MKTVTCSECDGHGHTLKVPIEICSKCKGYGKLAASTTDLGEDDYADEKDLHEDNSTGDNSL